MNENEAMKDLADGLWVYFEPKIKSMMNGCTKQKKGKVTSTPSNGYVGVTFPFDQEIQIPYVSSLSLSVGNIVWVEAPDGNPINWIVVSKGNKEKA